MYFLPTVSQVQISSFTPGQGSLGGGVIVTILGVGFSTDTYLGSNVVLIGPYQCNVINHLTSDTVITCETVAGSAGAYSLTVLVDGTSSDNQCCFSYSDSLTPTLKAVQPAAGPPGSNVQIYGADVWQVDYDCSQWSYITTDPCVGEITFGDYLCGINSENIALVYDAVGYSGFFQDSVYSLNCTLPDALVMPAPGLGVGASLNATVHFGANMNGGSALVERGAYIADSTGDRPYLFQLYPVVNSVSPSQGSLAGGTLLQISGSGFPDTSLPLLNNSINITVGWATCTVVSSNYSQVLCLTPSSGSTTSTTSSLTLPNGTSVYPGMRGISFEVYNYSYTSFSDLNNLGSGAITVQSTNGSSFALQGLWETPFSLYNVPYYCDRSKAIFIPPSTGNYTFWLAADDMAQLKATWMQANGTQATEVVIATVTSFTGNPGYWKSSRWASQKGEEKRIMFRGT
ncbi:hypothetical protein CEUSTIGMA_g8554.t1 [Chlamydomonas eustigma]|uniref:IPT/TIG domain-containing protein n=1 Tax=Chlamydomonas eustigma TaxID=1157962 RepID=A0A250XED0_9CHLO|nr:hypothetical protein CEUSTIGMA_g8554.t1 [Chlamydomonas eustigma]|eukprot:GAX81120.1 hypothetical protein CEUSTIGMA_g8554.t1 [Chlamydomonas eustigma]